MKMTSPEAKMMAKMANSQPAADHLQRGCIGILTSVSEAKWLKHCIVY